MLFFNELVSKSLPEPPVGARNAPGWDPLLGIPWPVLQYPECLLSDVLLHLSSRLVQSRYWRELFFLVDQNRIGIFTFRGSKPDWRKQKRDTWSSRSLMRDFLASYRGRRAHMYEPMTISNKQKLFFWQLLISDKTNRHTYDRSLSTPADHCRSDGQVQNPGSGHTPEDQSRTQPNWYI